MYKKGRFPFFISTFKFPKLPIRFRRIQCNNTDHPMTAFNTGTAIGLPAAVPGFLDGVVGEVDVNIVVSLLPDKEVTKDFIFHRKANKNPLVCHFQIHL